MEAIRLALGLPSLMSLFESVSEAWQFVDAGRVHEECPSYFRTRLDHQRVIFLIWAEASGFLSPAGYNKALDAPQVRGNHIRETLKHIALLLSDTEKLVDEYGFQIHTTSRDGQILPPPAIFQEKYTRLKDVMLGQTGTRSSTLGSRAKLRQQKKEIEIWKKCQWSIRDEKRSTAFLEKVTSLVDDLDKLSRGVTVPETIIELATESVSEVSLAALMEIEETSKDQATVISSAASIRLRSFEEQESVTVATGTGTFVTDRTLSPQIPALGSSPSAQQKQTPESPPMAHLRFRALEMQNYQAVAKLAASEPMPPRAGYTLHSPERVNQRVLTEMRSWAESDGPNGWYTLSPVEDADLRRFLGSIRGPKGTPYEGGIFHVRINLNEHYPYRAPTVWFLTKILHPNIDSCGAICADVLVTAEMWSPVFTMEKLLISLASLLDSPNWDEPVEDVFPMELVQNELAFNMLAKACTQKYATGHIIYPEEREDGFSTVCDVASSGAPQESWISKEC